jgi:putative transposase
VHFTIRHGDQADSTIILTALGVDLTGNKEVLSLRACAEEGKNGWISVLQDLRARGATQIDLIVTDGHDGVLAAVSELFAATPRQRCLVHKQRNVLNAIPRREHTEVQADLVGIWQQPSKQEAVVQLKAFKATYGKRYPEAVRSLAEEEEKTLTFYEFPAAMHRYIQTTNAIESLSAGKGGSGGDVFCRRPSGAAGTQENVFADLTAFPGGGFGHPGGSARLASISA